MVESVMSRVFDVRTSVKILSWTFVGQGVKFPLCSIKFYNSRKILVISSLNNLKLKTSCSLVTLVQKGV